jgi:4-oxalomesaconate hydratase
MRMLVFSAHSADFCSRSGGTIAKHARDGAEVHVVVLSYGERSESAGLYAGGARPTLDEVKQVRHEEATEAAGSLGAGIEFLDWGDLSFDYSLERAKVLADIIREFQPDAILTHHGPDPKSVDHDTTAQLVRRAAQIAGAAGLESPYPAARGGNLFFFEATVPLTELEGFNPDFYVNITDVWETKVQALQAYQRAQGFLLEWYTDVARLRAFQARRLSGRSDILYAEAFERTGPWVGEHLPLDERL